MALANFPEFHGVPVALRRDPLCPAEDPYTRINGIHPSGFVEFIPRLQTALIGHRKLGHRGVAHE